MPAEANGGSPHGPQETQGAGHVPPTHQTVQQLVNAQGKGATSSTKDADTMSIAESTTSTAVRRALDPDAARQFDSKMRGVSARVKELGNVFAPWNVVDNKAKAKQVAQILEKDRAQMAEMMNGMIEAYKEMSREAAEARMELADKNDRDRLAREHEERIEKMNSEVSQLREFKQTQSSNMRTLLGKVDSLRSRNQANQNVKSDGLSESELLQQRIEVLLAEHEKLTVENEKAVKAKMDMEKKLKEVTTKLTDENEVKGREIKHYQTLAKKAEEKKDAEIAAYKKEMGEQLEKKKKDIDLMQRRLNASKTEVDGYKSREKTNKAQLDEANAALAKAHEEVKAAKSKMADTRAAKEELQRDLSMAHYEAELVADVYRELVQSVVENQGFEALPVSKSFVKHTAPFPRTAFTLKNGKVLYNRAVHSGIDVSKIVPREYKDHKELQHMMADEGLVLDKQCGAETF